MKKSKAKQPEKSKTGRPTTFTPELAQRIISYIEMGNYLDTAAYAAGSSPQTVREWIRRGEGKIEDGAKRRGQIDRKRDADYARFAADIKRAEAEAEAACVVHVRAGMAGNWAAAMTFLERRHRQRWSRQEVRVEQNPDGTPIERQSKVMVYLPDNGRGDKVK